MEEKKIVPLDEVIAYRKEHKLWSEDRDVCREREWNFWDYMGEEIGVGFYGWMWNYYAGGPAGNLHYEEGAKEFVCMTWKEKVIWEHIRTKNPDCHDVEVNYETLCDLINEQDVTEELFRLEAKGLIIVYNRSLYEETPEIFAVDVTHKGFEKDNAEYSWETIMKNIKTQGIKEEKERIRLKNKEEKPKNGYIYYMHSDLGTKIGLSVNKTNRTGQLKTIMPCEELRIDVFSVNNRVKAEKRLHKEFKDKRFKGEWFHLKLEDFSIGEQILKEEFEGKRVDENTESYVETYKRFPNVLDK
jgi:hypothetical protein